MNELMINMSKPCDKCGAVLILNLSNVQSGRMDSFWCPSCGTKNEFIYIYTEAETW